jgi:hypothetical protein
MERRKKRRGCCHHFHGPPRNATHLKFNIEGMQIHIPSGWFVSDARWEGLIKRAQKLLSPFSGKRSK